MNLGISRRGWTTFSLISVMLLISMVGFTQLRQGFFPTTSTPLFFVDLFQAQGTDIRAQATSSLTECGIAYALSRGSLKFPAGLAEAQSASP